jgi:MFS family permease
MTMSNELPEPLAHPGILEEETRSIATAPPRTTTRRLGVALFILGFAWVFANGALVGVILAAKFAILDEPNKVFLFGLATAIGGVGTTLSLFFWGAISDLTRSRLGRRAPWILFGGVAGPIFFVLMALADSPVLLLVAFVGYGLAFNSLTSAALAVFADRVPREKRGTISAVYGGAQVIGGTFGSITASRFLEVPNTFMYIGAVMIFVGAVLFVLLAPDNSSKDVPRAKLDVRGLLDAFRFPKNAPDFYWAFAGRFLLLLGLYVVQNFTLYILTDYIGLTKGEAGDIIAISGIATLVTIVLGTFLGGPLSDKLKRRKLPIFIASLLFAVAVLVPFVWPTGTAMIIFAALSSLGLGAFLSIDTALMTEVIPSQEQAGKDLGILNTANTVPQVIAPLLTAAIVGIGFGYAPVFIVSLVIMLIGAFSIFKIKSVR